jgi:hypothetical protein
VEELLAERRIMVDRVTVYRWVQTFTAEFIDETYVKVAGHWSYLYRAVDQHGQDIDMLVSTRRNAEAVRSFFTHALTARSTPVEITTDRAPTYPRVLGEPLPAARRCFVPSPISVASSAANGLARGGLDLRAPGHVRLVGLLRRLARQLIQEASEASPDDR